VEGIVHPKKEHMKPKTEEVMEVVPSLDELQRERKHIETLFADRINFYLVFAAGVLIFVLDKEHAPGILKIALGAVIAVSILMLIALFRTLLLVLMVLKEIVKYYPDLSYSRYCKRLWYLPNANRVLFLLPVTMTALFCYAYYLLVC
jgi:hypothetical protein